MTSSDFALPQEIWKRWSSPDYDSLRQAVIVFGGNTTKEAAIEAYSNVSLYYQDKEGTSMIKGTFYLTSSRLAFLPNNQIPHPQLVVLRYDLLRSLAGFRNDLSITVKDNSGSVANFKFANAKALYQCFHLLRGLAEAIRMKNPEYIKTVYQLVTTPARDETPFAAIEFDLPECNESKNLEFTAPNAMDPIAEEDDHRNDALVVFLQPIKSMIDYCNHLHFDIHIKLRILFFIGVISFILKFIPLLPLCGAIIAGVQLYHVWAFIKGNMKDDVSESFSGQHFEGYEHLRQFYQEYFMWKNQSKCLKLFAVSLSVFFGWVIFPPKLYYTVIFGSYAFFLIYPLLKSNIYQEVVNGFWYST